LAARCAALSAAICAFVRRFLLDPDFFLGDFLFLVQCLHPPLGFFAAFFNFFVPAGHMADRCAALSAAIWAFVRRLRFFLLGDFLFLTEQNLHPFPCLIGFNNFC